MPKKQPTRKTVEAIKHDDDKRKNIPTAEFQPVLNKEEQKPLRVVYERRNRDLDPQLVWRGKDEQDWSDLVVSAPPLYIQEKVHPQVLIEDLLAQTKAEQQADDNQLDLFADFNGIPQGVDRTEFYQHDQNWSNRMILGDSLQVMASLAEREGLRGKVQCIYFDPPYGIKFNSNFQWSTTSRDVKDGKGDHITREPEQVKAFRDTWRDGIHSYLTYLRDRLTVARDLLSDSGSIFVQIGDENVHRVRALMDEVFGDENFTSEIVVSKTSSQTSLFLASTCDHVIWYAKNRTALKFRQLFEVKDFNDPLSAAGEYKNLWKGFGDYVTGAKAVEQEQKTLQRFRPDNTISQSGSETTRFTFSFNGQEFKPSSGGWKSNLEGFTNLAKADRLMTRKNSISYVRFLEDFPVSPVGDLWTDVRWGF
jgi:adenine-specific DNA-methyltransferase